MTLALDRRPHAAPPSLHVSPVPGWAAVCVLSLLVQLLAGLPTASAQPFGPWGPAVSVDPLRAGVNTGVNDGCPIEAPDGQTLYFASDRAGSLDIWVAYREGDQWSAPERLPFPVNTDGAAEFCPTPLPGHKLLFVSTRAANCGGAANPDFYVTHFTGARGWAEPRPLNCAVNSPAQEFSPSLVRGGGVTMLFFSSNRADPMLHKIYMSVMENGDWGPATQVDELNWPGASDARPNVRKQGGGLEIVFDSTRAGGTQIFTALRPSLSEGWSAPALLDPSVNLGSSQSRASLSRDGTRLYFGSNAANGPTDTGSDIFVSTRPRSGKQ